MRDAADGEEGDRREEEEPKWRLERSNGNGLQAVRLQLGVKMTTDNPTTCLLAIEPLTFCLLIEC